MLSGPLNVRQLTFSSGIPSSAACFSNSLRCAIMLNCK